MKKKLAVILTTALSLTLALGIVGCSTPKEESNNDMTIDKLYTQGYTLENSSLAGEEGTWKAYYVKDCDWSHPYLVETPMTQDEFNDIFAAETDEDVEKMLSAKEDLTITDLSDQVPAKEEFDKYTGKSLSDLEEEGYFVEGCSEDPDGNVIIEAYKPGEYVLSISVNEKLSFDDFNSGNVDTGKLTVKEATFSGFPQE